MANLIKLKRSAVAGKVPAVGDLALGELALNTYDGKLYTKKDNGVESIVDLSANPGGGGTTGPVLEASYRIDQNVVLGTNKHGLSLYDVEIVAGYSVEVPAGAVWTIASL